MSMIDFRTAYILSGALYLLMPVFTFIVLAGQRTLPLILWCIGGFLTGISLVMGSLHGIYPDWVSIAIPQPIVYAGHLMRIQSLRLDLNTPVRTQPILVVWLALSLIFLGIALGLSDDRLRITFNASVQSILVLYLAFLAWRIGIGERNPSAHWIAGIYLLGSFALIFRAVSTHFGASTSQVVGSPQVLVVPLAALVTAVVGHFGYIGIVLDRSTKRELAAIADRVRDDERRHLGEQIAQLDRQRSLGEMSASLGHELNQPLTAILTNAEVGKLGTQTGRFDNTQVIDFFDKIIYNTQRASQIVERIRNFIRPVESKRVPVNMNLIVDEVASLVADEARGQGVTVKLPSAPPVWVTGDPIQLSQIVLNALRNAIEAMSCVTQRYVEVTCFNADGRAILHIRDTGSGISTEDLDRVGSPFFTTKPNGLGMGIAISRSIAEQHGGTLTLTNAEGGGTLVELTLPAMPESKR